MALDAFFFFNVQIYMQNGFYAQVYKNPSPHDICTPTEPRQPHQA
jgi:hypothetical protein